MLIQLKLKNYKTHIDVDFSFTEGMNVIRGLNEQGKSSIFQSIAYALFGARALPDSLEDTVTWEQPVGSLRVELTFMVGKNTFKIVRKKSGAELTGEGVTASGHAEVTAFVERQLGASSKVAQATLLTNQKSLTDGLDSSSTPLIEKLAGLDLFDVLVNGIQTTLPCGNTKALEAQVNAELGMEVPVDNSPALKAIATNLEAAYNNTLRLQQAAEADAAELQPAYVKAKDAEKSWKAKDAEVVSTQAALDTLLAKQVKLPEAPDMTAVPQLTEAALHSAQQAEFARLDALVDSLESVQGRMSTAAYAHDVELHTKRANEARAAHHSASMKLAGLLSSRIVEVRCKICEQELADIPAVRTFNSNLQVNIDTAQAEVAAAQAAEAAASAELLELSGLAKADKAITKRLGRDVASQFLKIDSSTTPVTVTKLFTVGEFDLMAQAKLAALQAAKANYDTAVAAAAVRQEGLTAMQQKLEALRGQLAVFATQLDPEAVTRYTVSEAEVLRRQRSTAEAFTAFKNAESAAVQEERMFAVRSEAYKSAVAKKAELLELLKQYQFNNALLTKLRDTRPQVAAQLWALVLGGVSHYFSAIRGTPSVVTRDADGFRIDGKSAKMFSGSTQDALGLAQRLVLLKTFLPNTSFMLVDEPGAACDDTRETEMLATLSACGVRQVLIVTHSDLADAYAANIIRI